MTRLAVSFVVALLMSFSISAPLLAAPSKPNVILFLVDDMGWMDSTPYGSQYYVTPNMDRLAKQSMRFTDAYALPLCSPTRASLLSGQYSARHGVTSASGHQPPQPAGFAFLPATGPANRAVLYPESKNYLEPSQVTLAEALKAGGYRTAHIGKWHLGLTRPHWPEAQGFDVAFHCHPDPGPPGNYFSPYGVTADGEPRGPKRVGTITDGPAGEYIVDRLADEAIKFIDASKGQPFFLNFWQYGVHGPWGHKEAYTAELANRTDPRGLQGNPIMASMLRSVDESLGRILDRLDELKIADNTIVIFMSDNGGNTHSNVSEDRKTARKAETPALADWRKWAGDKPPTNNAPLRDGKGRLYEGGIRVPLMVRWPGRVAAGSTSDAVVGPIDIYPTVLELTGVARPPGQMIDGVSLSPVLNQTGKLSREAYFTWFPHLVPGVAVRKGDWKLIRRFEPRADYEGLHELFNLKEDIGETKNLAAAMPEKVAEFNALIDGFVKETGALYPKPNPDYKPGAAVAPKPATPTAPGVAPADALQGLVPRFCKATPIDGAVRIEADGKSPFLGVPGNKGKGPLTLKLRIRATHGGEGKVTWKTAEQAEFPATGQTVSYKLAASGDFQEVSVEVPIEGQAGIIRVYLPLEAGAVDLAAISFTPKDGKPVKAWDFREAKK